MNKAKQDRSLENIERGLGVLGEAATAMGENVQHQDALVDAVTEKVHLCFQTAPVLQRGTA